MCTVLRQSWARPQAALSPGAFFFQPPLEDDVLIEGPAFPINSTFVQELFQAQYRYLLPQLPADARAQEQVGSSQIPGQVGSLCGCILPVTALSQALLEALQGRGGPEPRFPASGA